MAVMHAKSQNVGLKWTQIDYSKKVMDLPQNMSKNDR